MWRGSSRRKSHQKTTQSTMPPQKTTMTLSARPTLSLVMVVMRGCWKVQGMPTLQLQRLKYSSLTALCVKKSLNIPKQNYGCCCEAYSVPWSQLSWSNGSYRHAVCTTRSGQVDNGLPVPPHKKFVILLALPSKRAAEVAVQPLDMLLLLSAPPLLRKMVEGYNNRFYAHRPMVSPPSNRNPGCKLIGAPSIQPAGAPPPRERSTNPWHVVVCLCLCSWTSVLLCVVLICKDGIVVMGVWLRRFCLNRSVVGDICLFWVGSGYVGCSG